MSSLVPIVLLVCCLQLLVSVIVNGAPVCVFDIDQTLTRQPLASASSCGVSSLPAGSDLRLPAVYASEAISACYDAGFNLAIATAEAKILAEASIPWLTDLSGNRFNSSFFASPAFGYGASNKTDMLLAIQQYYQVSSSCVVLFDDQMSNVNTAIGLGMIGQETSSACGGNNSFCLTACGIEQSEFESGLAKLKTTCQTDIAPASVLATV